MSIEVGLPATWALHILCLGHKMYLINEHFTEFALATQKLLNDEFFYESLARENGKGFKQIENPIKSHKRAINQS